MKKNPIPFGLFFEESTDNQLDCVEPLYDEDRDISVYFDKKEGCSFPYVEYFGVVNTKTYTKTIDENSDEDDNHFSLLSTRTDTFTQTENSDEDDDLKPKNFFVFNTRTDTRELNENSDSDDSGT